MTKEYFLELADYHIWANNIVCEWLDKISEEQWKQNIVSSFNSIYETVLHVAAAEKLWNERLKKYTDLVNMTGTFKGSNDELLKIWKEQSENLKKFIQDFPESSLNEKLAFKNIKGIAFNLPYWQLFAHVINHSTYHRGQLVTMLRQAGYTNISSIDLTTYFRLKN